ncbi:hypothetical protein [Streptomyces virginiae]|uniref:hypothetical protein n=1 Tax=Streptomyces virginiae TaxID=1961 RepID=UPI002257E721|nr:hypothetical protein [Streptomyces virginiae]MCX5174488.1 hypothetical protein [Streptomyces virginiae]
MLDVGVCDPVQFVLVGDQYEGFPAPTKRSRSQRRTSSRPVCAALVTPPLEAGLRALWATVLPDHGRRRVVQALDTGSQGLLYIAASWLATTHGPNWRDPAPGNDVVLALRVPWHRYQ